MSHCERPVIIGNGRGVHSRVATRLAEIAAQFGVRMCIRQEEEWVNCTSILDVLALGLVQDTPVTVRAEGEQAEAALTAAVNLLLSEDDP